MSSEGANTKKRVFSTLCKDFIFYTSTNLNQAHRDGVSQGGNGVDKEAFRYLSTSCDCFLFPFLRQKHNYFPCKRFFQITVRLLELFKSFLSLNSPIWPISWPKSESLSFFLLFCSCHKFAGLFGILAFGREGRGVSFTYSLWVHCQ